MPEMRCRDARHGVELRLVPDQPVLGDPALRVSRPHSAAAGTGRERACAWVPGPGPRARDGRARRQRRTSRAQGAADRPARDAGGVMTWNLAGSPAVDARHMAKVDCSVGIMAYNEE